MKGLYPQSAVDLANEVADLQPGDKLNVEPVIGAYEEIYEVLDPDDLIPVKDGLVIQLTQRIYRNDDNIGRSIEQKQWTFL